MLDKNKKNFVTVCLFAPQLTSFPFLSHGFNCHLILSRNYMIIIPNQCLIKIAQYYNSLELTDSQCLWAFSQMREDVSSPQMGNGGGTVALFSSCFSLIRNFHTHRLSLLLQSLNGDVGFHICALETKTDEPLRSLYRNEQF